MKSGNINQYKSLSQFDTLKSFNNSIEQWMVDCKSKFTKGELVALKRLVRFSAKVFGVCNAKIGTIVKATHEGTVGISRSTFKRMLKKAQEMNLLTVHHTFNYGKQGHSVYVFNPYQSMNQQQDVSISESIEPLQQEQIEPLENYTSLKTNNINNKERSSDRLDKKYTSSNVPKEFTDLAGCYYDDYKVIEELYKCVKLSTRYYSYYTQSDRTELACNAFRQLIRNIKQGKGVKNIYGYFWGILNRIMDNEYSMWLFGESA
ncbi:hypothetical protein [Priestia filamentosa]|uniref:hypothetical protein n=1 Tax=Priestia filamentosa TaxID=1402861 RepID=UPI000A089E04|nr:hypothetical protein [Priestia filamentosa]OXS67231.1 hypothetical protein B1B01_17215 [Priestia filamentosa]SMF53479.1 hypothetical protein SAMN06296056_104234 [Priestia filamentosa]